MSQWQGMFLRVKHAWTCLLRVLATWDFHATVAKGKEEALEPSQQSGFQQPGFWITMLGFRIPLAGFRIPKPWIPDSTDQNYLDSGFRITLHGANSCSVRHYGRKYPQPSLLITLSFLSNVYLPEVFSGQAFLSPKVIYNQNCLGKTSILNNFPSLLWSMRGFKMRWDCSR